MINFFKAIEFLKTLFEQRISFTCYHSKNLPHPKKLPYEVLSTHVKSLKTSNYEKKIRKHVLFFLFQW